MFAEGGEEIDVVLFSDGHIEVDTEHGRWDPPSRKPGSRVYLSSEEFLAALDEQSDD